MGRLGTGRVPIGVNASDSDFSYVEKTGGSKTINLSHKHLETVGADNGNMYLEEDRMEDDMDQV